MKKQSDIPEKILFAAAASALGVCACCYAAAKAEPALIPGFVALFGLSLLLLSYTRKPLPSRRLKVCAFGSRLLAAFAVMAVAAVVYHLYGLSHLFRGSRAGWWLSVLTAVLVSAAVFWSGIIMVYLTSLQLGIRLRVLGAVFGMVPLVHLYFLARIIATCRREVDFESMSYVRDQNRSAEQVCATRYPLVLVHGVFFRDYKYLNYWGRIPAALEKNGARIYYGGQESAASVEECGRQLADRIRSIIDETGCGKVNIIGHSKGGLDSRWAISRGGLAPYVASLTTINTPHRGCIFVDYLLDKVPAGVREGIARAYNAALLRFGDRHPDFLKAVNDLRSTVCVRLDRELGVPEGVFCQSVGSCTGHVSGGKFPLNMSYPLVKHFDGENDGLVGYDSFKFGQSFTYLKPNGSRGISHGDMIDLNRENIPGFDVREFYVQLVADLKRRGF